jgi:xanthine dehydrogenase iron-sulfur cluster and FAD-binding subunit A
MRSCRRLRKAIQTVYERVSAEKKSKDEDPLLLQRKEIALRLFAGQHRRMAWGAQKSRRRLQAVCPEGGPALKHP